MRPINALALAALLAACGGAPPPPAAGPGTVKITFGHPDNCAGHIDFSATAALRGRAPDSPVCARFQLASLDASGAAARCSLPLDFATHLNPDRGGLPVVDLSIGCEPGKGSSGLTYLRVVAEQFSDCLPECKLGLAISGVEPVEYLVPVNCVAGEDVPLEIVAESTQQ
jgi:hypothetical protein